MSFKPTAPWSLKASLLSSSMFRSFFTYILLLLVLSPSYLLISISISNGTVACYDPAALAWYTSNVGETPCMTYQRLRRICNNDFQLGLVDFDSLPESNPESMCSDQIADCCCNHIAFNLGMLCISCQRGLGDGNGFNARPGTYQRYLTGQHTDGTFCSPHTNETLKDSVEAGVCGQGMKMIYDLYDGGNWVDGSWFYKFYSERATLNLNGHGDKAFHSCSATSTSTSSSQVPSTAPPSSTSPSLSTGVPSHTSPSPSTGVLGYKSLSPSTGVPSYTSPSPSTGFPNYTSTSTSISTTQPSASDSGSDPSQTTALDDSDHISRGAMAGISAAVPIVVLSIIAITVYLVCRSRRRKRKRGLTPYILTPPSTTSVSESHIGGTGTGSRLMTGLSPLRGPSSAEMSAERSDEREERPWMCEGRNSEDDRPPPAYESLLG
ncbi:hypothetical protein E1B28_013193 [Marasmius oreades]|uniref:Uncharacterized protein n=1 Tax=Marasmius oreades TaxID=181124 RepID=A0A9P7UME5_9AGAR|nr:uncharacterized protein E1B28_013193 [Marasmius oreades]KAG7087213.1 hypothetical protein E1B28_013193 [Marasmius oreades]